MAAIRSHGLSIGIVGLPNSGKSTLFNALTHASVPAENYPFCTIDKNVGVIKVADPRLDRLEEFFNSAESIPSAIRFVDIAGLVKGASKGEGLGNKFLGHIREVDAIMYVLRGFESESVSHVFDRVHPVDDLKIVRSELMIKDIETLERVLPQVEDEKKGGNGRETEEKIDAVKKVLSGLSDELPAISADLNDDQREFIDSLWLLTAKPAMYVINVKCGINRDGIDMWIDELKTVIPEQEHAFVLPVDSKSENEMSNLTDEDRRGLEEMIDDCLGVNDIVDAAYKRLDLITFYTGNEKEVNAWGIRNGANAQEAAGVIHTDLAENFVTADVVDVENMMDAGGWVQAKEHGLVKNVGKEYVVKDGDYIHVLAHRA